MKIHHSLIIGGMIMLLIAMNACGTCRNKCNTKHKIRTEMGWM